MAYATSGAAIVTGALKALGVLGEGETPNADVLADGLSRLNELIDALGTQRMAAYRTARTTFVTTPNVGTYAIGPGQTINQIRPEAIEQAAYLSPGTTQEIPLALYDVEQYASLPDKTAVIDSAPYALHYDPDSPSGSLILYPKPTAAVTLVLYVRTLLRQLDLNTSVTLPAGYAKMLRYALAKEWAPDFGKAADQVIHQLAADALADVKRVNTVIHPMHGDVAISGFGGVYDITSDQYR